MIGMDQEGPEMKAVGVVTGLDTEGGVDSEGEGVLEAADSGDEDAGEIGIRRKS